MGSVMWKIVAGLAGVAATQVAAKATNKGWAVATGNPAPVGKHDPNYTAKQAMVFALVSTAVAGAFKAFAERKAAAYYTKSFGHAPDVVEKERKKAAEQAAARLKKA